jgi:hypothetical protein
MRPNPLGATTSTAIATLDFVSVSLPLTQSSLPPT